MILGDLILLFTTAGDLVLNEKVRDSDPSARPEEVRPEREVAERNHYASEWVAVLVGIRKASHEIIDGRVGECFGRTSTRSVTPHTA